MSKIGRFGEYGGQYVPEIVMNAVNELNEAYEKYKNDPEFLSELRQLYRDYANRPSLLYYAEKMATQDIKISTFDFTFGFVGRIFYEKGINELVALVRGLRICGHLLAGIF